MTNNQPERSVEEWEKEFDSFFEVYTATDKYGKTVGSWNAPDVFTIKNFIRSTLQTERQKREEMVEAEWERCISIVQDYGERMSELHQKMIGTAHEDSKMMLAFDMHSRLIAVKHITEKLTQPPTPLTKDKE